MFLQIQLSGLGGSLPCYSSISALSHYDYYKYMDLLTVLPVDSIWVGIVFFFSITLCLFPFLSVLLSFCRH